MQNYYEIKQAYTAKSKDLTQALDIYIKSVDDDSLTSTNEIRDYIKQKYNEKRKMFFYILYLNKAVVGFAEFGYLPNNQALIVDYISTNPRNHTLFYMFYHMLIEDIELQVKNKKQYVKYIITELSLKEHEHVLVDTDSLYFRQLLANENFFINKAPYFQPQLDYKYTNEAIAFNLAIKPNIEGFSNKYIMDKEKYLYLISELYFDHYLAWYEHFYKNSDIQVIRKNINELYDRICNEYPHNLEIKPISAINCDLLNEGKCKALTIENVTLSNIRKKKITTIVKILIWLLLSVVTSVLCWLPQISDFVLKICSIITILSGLISFFQFRKQI